MTATPPTVTVEQVRALAASAAAEDNAELLAICLRALRGDRAALESAAETIEAEQRFKSGWLAQGG